MSPFSPSTIPFPGVIQSTAKDVAAAQMKALATTGVELVPAPGAGKAIIPMGLLVELKWNSVAYTDPGGTADLVVCNSSSPTAPAWIWWEFLSSNYAPASPAVALFIQPSNAYWFTPAPLYNSPYTESVPPFANQPVGLVNYGANLAAGNSPVRFTVYYAIVTLLA